MQTFTDSEGWTATYNYDAADRLTSIAYPDGTTRQYGCNETGRPPLDKPRSLGRSEQPGAEPLPVC